MKRSRLALLSIAICTAILALSGCGSSVMSNPSHSGTAPTVTNAGLQVNGVAANRWLYVQFSEDMDPSTINSKTITVADSSGAAVPGNIMYDANFDVAGFQPNPADEPPAPRRPLMPAPPPRPARRPGAPRPT